jgi:chemotaxis protein methyltransferase CheR
VLEKASQGIYEAGRVKLPNPAWLARYFQEGRGEWEGHYRVKQALRGQVQFEHMNLLHPGLRARDRFHLIFCRNVMIYFDQATAEQLMNRLFRQLHPGGYLIIGHAESLQPRPAGLVQVKPSIFQKRAA